MINCFKIIKDVCIFHIITWTIFNRRRPDSLRTKPICCISYTDNQCLRSHGISRHGIVPPKPEYSVSFIKRVESSFCVIQEPICKLVCNGYHSKQLIATEMLKNFCTVPADGPVTSGTEGSAGTVTPKCWRSSASSSHSFPDSRGCQLDEFLASLANTNSYNNISLVFNCVYFHCFVIVVLYW